MIDNNEPKLFVKSIKDNIRIQQPKDKSILINNKINDFCQNLTEVSIMRSTFNTSFYDKTTLEIVCSLIGSYNCLMDKAKRDMDLKAIDEARLDAFKVEIQGILTPDSVEEPYHDIPNLTGAYKQIRRDALLIDACNNLVHAFETTQVGRMGANNVLMNLKDKLMTKAAIDCIKVKENNPKSPVSVGYTKDKKKNIDVMAIDCPFVGQVSWHLSPRVGASALEKNITAFFSQEKAKESLNTQSTVTLGVYEKALNIDTRNNLSRLMNDVRVVGPNRALSAYEKSLRRYIQWIPVGFTSNGLKKYKTNNLLNEQGEKPR